jgi:1-acyl-sn-glycerol-3-phosphate acyltransferase
MIRPTANELAALSLTERTGFRLADFAARHLRPAATAWNSTALVAITELLVRRRIRPRGLDYLRALDPERSVALVANHRSFFDFFAIECALFRWSRLPRRLLFPVRSNFFYDNPLGIGINLALSGMAMFPPILRDPSKRAFNRYALRRCAAELELGRVVVGLHPEGSRSRDPDPLQLRAGKLGIGELLLAAPRTQVVPVFIAGLSNDLRLEWRRNWLAPAESPIWISFGAQLDLSDLHARPEERRSQREAVNRCMAAIAGLADDLRPQLAKPGPGATTTQLGVPGPLADGRSRRRSGRSSRRPEEPKNRA